jgi:hypothetical protein
VVKKFKRIEPQYAMRRLDQNSEEMLARSLTSTSKVIRINLQADRAINLGTGSVHLQRKRPIQISFFAAASNG